MKAASDRKIARLAKRDAFKAKTQVLALHGAKHVKTMQEDGQYPGAECFGVWPLSEDCDNQWGNWFDFCDEGDWSDERCQGSVDAWFASGLDFKTPDSLSNECSEFSWDAFGVCLEAWETVWGQCMGELEDPYFWTDDCDLIDEIAEALGEEGGEYSEEEDDYEYVNLKKRFNARKSASLKARVAMIKNKAVQKKADAFKAHVQSLAKHGLVLQENGIAYPPDRDCIYFDTYDASKCDAQWNEWEWFCLDNWVPMCERVYAEFYSQDAEWIWPERPAEHCAVAPADMSDNCMDQWDTLWKQCFWETDEDPKPMYMWSEDCDMVISFASAWNQWYGTDDWALNLKRAIKKMEPKHALAKKAAKAKKAAPAPVRSRKLKLYKRKPATKVMQDDWAIQVSPMPSDTCLNFYTMGGDNQELCDAEWAYWAMVCDDNWETEPAC